MAQIKRNKKPEYMSEVPVQVVERITEVSGLPQMIVYWILQWEVIRRFYDVNATPLSWSAKQVEELCFLIEQLFEEWKKLNLWDEIKKDFE